MTYKRFSREGTDDRGWPGLDVGRTSTAWPGDGFVRRPAVADRVCAPPSRRGSGLCAAQPSRIGFVRRQGLGGSSAGLRLVVIGVLQSKPRDRPSSSAWPWPFVLAVGSVVGRRVGSPFLSFFMTWPSGRSSVVGRSRLAVGRSRLGLDREGVRRFPKAKVGTGTPTPLFIPMGV
jgi:hypothetical protein